MRYTGPWTLILLATLLAARAAAQESGAAPPDAVPPSAPGPAGPVVPAALLDAGDDEARSSCYPETLLRSAYELRGRVAIRIETDGTASVDQWPEGASPEFQQTVECLVPLLRFAPATAAGAPVSSRVILPFELVLGEDG